MRRPLRPHARPVGLRATARVVTRLAPLVTALVAARPAAAQYIVTFTQTSAGVTATGAGSLDLTGLTFLSLGGGLAPAVNPARGIALTGAPGSTIQAYGGVPGLPAFGTGGFAAASSGSGDFVGAGTAPASSTFPGGFILVPLGYSSGAALSDGALYTGATFATLGLAPGTYREAWDQGRGSFTVQVGRATVVPEPATWALLGVGLVGVGAAARRRSGSTERAGGMSAG